MIGEKLGLKTGTEVGCKKASRARRARQRLPRLQSLGKLFEERRARGVTSQFGSHRTMAATRGDVVFLGTLIANEHAYAIKPGGFGGNGAQVADPRESERARERARRGRVARPRTELIELNPFLVSSGRREWERGQSVKIRPGDLGVLGGSLRLGGVHSARVGRQRRFREIRTGLGSSVIVTAVKYRGYHPYCTFGVGRVWGVSPQNGGYQFLILLIRSEDNAIEDMYGVDELQVR